MDGAGAERYRLDINVHAVGVRIGLGGSTDSVSQWRACWQRVAAELVRRRPPAALLVDEREGALASVGQLEGLLDGIAHLGLQQLPIAYVGDWRRLPQLEVLNMALLERGYRVRVFDVEADAVRWLRYGEHAAARDAH